MPTGVYPRTEAMRAKAREVAIAHGGSFAGRKHSEESKEKMRLARLNSPGHWLGKTRGPHSEATKAKMRAAKQQSGFMPSEQARALAQQARIGSSHSAESRAKIRAALATPEVKAKLSGPNPLKRRQAAHYERLAALNRGTPARYPMRRFYYADTAFRSTWEVRAAKALDALGVRWEYEAHRFDLGSQTYAPDFYLPDDNAFWEVKGYFGPKSQRTVSLFRALRPEPLVLIGQAALHMLERAAAMKAA